MDNTNDDHVIGDGPQDFEFIPRTTVFIIDAQAADAKMLNVGKFLRNDPAESHPALPGFVIVRCYSRNSRTLLTYELAKAGLAVGVDYESDSDYAMPYDDAKTFRGTWFDRATMRWVVDNESHPAPTPEPAMSEEDQLKAFDAYQTQSLDNFTKIARMVGINEEAIAKALAMPDHNARVTALGDLMRWHGQRRQ